MKRQVRTFTFLPSIDTYLENPYWKSLKTALVEAGLRYADKSDGNTHFFGRRWMLENRGKVDVIHFHFVQQFYNYETHYARLRWVLRFASNLILARLLGYRTVFTLHDLRPTLPLQPYWVDYLGHWAALNLTNIVLVHSASARQATTKMYGRRHNIGVVTHPSYIGTYPDNSNQHEARARLGIGAEKRVFLYFGGVRPNKGIELLLRSFREVPGDDLLLIVAGKPQPGLAYDQLITQLAAQDDRIRVMLHYIPDDEIQYLMHSTDVVVLPFTRILTSGSVILAFSFGKPVIVPALGDLVDVVHPDIGFLYKPLDDLSLQQVLQTCAHEDADTLHSMGVLAREKVRQFTYTLLAQQTLNAYMGGKQT